MEAIEEFVGNAFCSNDHPYLLNSVYLFQIDTKYFISPKSMLWEGIRVF